MPIYSPIARPKLIILWNPKVKVVSRPHSFKTTFNIILPSTLRSPKRSFTLRFSDFIWSGRSPMRPSTSIAPNNSHGFLRAFSSPALGKHRMGNGRSAKPSVRMPLHTEIRSPYLTRFSLPPAENLTCTAEQKPMLNYRSTSTSNISFCYRYFSIRRPVFEFKLSVTWAQPTDFCQDVKCIPR